MLRVQAYGAESVPLGLVFDWHDGLDWGPFHLTAPSITDINPGVTSPYVAPNRKRSQRYLSGFTTAVTHTTTGALVGPGSTVAGTAVRYRQFTTTGALTGQGSSVVGVAQHYVLHTSSGILTGQGSTVVGAATRTPAVISHDTSGVLTGQGSSIVGVAVRYALHTSTGVLVGPGSLLEGTATHSTPSPSHDSSGTLVGQGSAITGTATHYTLHTSSGVLVGQGSQLDGTAIHYTLHTSSGVLVGPGSTVNGSAQHTGPGASAYCVDYGVSRFGLGVGLGVSIPNYATVDEATTSDGTATYSVTNDTPYQVSQANWYLCDGGTLPSDFTFTATLPAPPT